VDRRDLFYLVRSPYSNSLYGIMQRRRREALEGAAERRGQSIFTEIAKMALGRWDSIDPKVVMQTIERINQRQDGCIVDLLGLIGALHRFNRKPTLKEQFKQVLKATVLNFRYGSDEPGEDIMNFQGESRQILFSTSEILAGQLYPKEIFTNTGQTGQWHREKGEGLALKWLNQCATYAAASGIPTSVWQMNSRHYLTWSISARHRTSKIWLQWFWISCSSPLRSIHARAPLDQPMDAATQPACSAHGWKLPRVFHV
jgi:hypothetical protein